MPTVIGPSQRVPGAVDVQTDDGRIVPLPPDQVQRMGLPEFQAPPSVDSRGPELAYAPMEDGVGPLPPRAPQPTPAAPPQAAQPHPGHLGGPPMERAKGQVVRYTPPGGGGGAVPAEAPAPQADPTMAGIDTMRTVHAASDADWAAGGGRGKYTGAPTKTVTTTESEEKLLTPEERAQLAELGERAEAGKARQVEAQVGQLDDRSAGEGAKGARTVQTEQGILDTEEQARETMDYLRSEAKALADSAKATDAEAKALREKYQSQETGRRVMAAVAGFAASFGDAMRGTPGQTANQISAMLREDFQRQLAEVEGLKGDAARKRSAAADLVSRMGDVSAAENAFVSIGLKAQETAMQGIESSTKSAEVKGRVGELRGAVAAEAAQAEQQAILANAPTQKKAITATEKKGGMVGGNPRKLSDYDKAYAGAVENAQGDQLKRELASGKSGPGSTRVRQQLTGLAKFEASIADTSTQLEEARALMFGPESEGLFGVSGVGRGSWANPSDEAKINRMKIQGLMNGYIQALSGAQVSPDEAERLVAGAGLDPGAPENVNREGIRRLDAVLAEKRAAFRASIDPDVAELYYSRKKAQQEAQNPAKGTAQNPVEGF